MATDEKVEKVRCANCIYLDDTENGNYKCGIYEKYPNLYKLRICYDHQS